MRGSDLPLYLAIASWLGPLFQLVMTADGANSVTPPVATMWIGGVMALALLLVVGGWYLARERRSTVAVSQHEGAMTQRHEELSSFASSRLPDFVSELWRSLRSADMARLALAIFVLGGLAHLGYMVWFAFQRTATDFWIFFRGARDWSRGLPLYDLGALADNFYGHVFKVPPFFAMLLLPFVSQDGLQVLFYFRILDAILIGATALVWLRMWRVRIVSIASLGVLVLLNFRPFADAMTGGQTDLILLFVLTLALWALQRERDALAGALLAFGVMLKLYPIVLLAFFVVKWRWRALAGFALGMLLTNGLAVAVMGWEPHRVYVTQVLLFSAGPTAWVENQAIAGFLARFIAPATDAVVVRSQGAKLLANAIAGAIGLLMCYLTLRPVKPTTTTYALQYGQFLLLMLLAAPAAWMHYETLLFLPFAALLLHWRDREVSLARAAALALSFGLIGYGNQWSYYDGTVMGVLTIAGMSYKLYGMLLLGGIIATTLWEEWALSGEPRLREMAAGLCRRLISNRKEPALPRRWQ